MLSGIEADGGKRLEIEILGVGGRRLKENLELIVVLKAVGVLAVTSIGRTAARLGIARTPRIGPEGTKRRRSMERARTDLGIVRLHDHAAL